MMKIEIWKQCEENPKWEVSSYGNLRWSATKEKASMYLHKTGYWTTTFTLKGKKKSCKIHRLVAKAFLPTTEGKNCVNHKDGVKTNNHIDNLEWCTQAENNKHAWENGLVTGLVGELNGRAILNEKLVHEICKDYVEGLMPKDVIEKYSITRNQAIKIKCKTTWKHITTQYNY